MKKQENYCSLGKSYGCPEATVCPDRGFISVEVLEIDERKKMYRNPDHEGEKFQSIPMHINEVIRRAKKWKTGERKDISYACTELREERPELISKIAGDCC